MSTSREDGVPPVGWDRGAVRLATACFKALVEDQVSPIPFCVRSASGEGEAAANLLCPTSARAPKHWKVHAGFLGLLGLIRMPDGITSTTNGKGGVMSPRDTNRSRATCIPRATQTQRGVKSGVNRPHSDGSARPFIL